ncbi:UvrD-helicase domain-containing protein [Streptomyces sp. NPDC000851]
MTPSDMRSGEGIAHLRAEAEAAQLALVNLDTAPGGIGRAVRAEACPGAGKTRTVVERHLTRPAGPRRGRAIVSFTKVAGAEIRKRCAEAGLPELTRFPHFVGTFDTFVWRHLVRPYIRNTDGRVWQRLESWSDHPRARREGVSLDDFHFTRGDVPVRIASPQLRPGRLPYALRNDEQAQGRLTAWARRTMAELWKEGYLSGDQLRDMALWLLRDAGRRDRIARVLITRFSEIIIDEAQDCSDEDLNIVELLHGLRVPLLLVGDPDQRIYGFRDKGVRPVDGQAREAHGTSPDHRLRHNWRSTQVICDLAHTLRTSNAPCDIAVGPYHSEASPVLLVPTTERAEAEWIRDFGTEAERLGIPRPERLVVAHGSSTLPKGLTGTPNAPSAQLPRLIWATAILRSPSASDKQRERAGKTLRESVLRYWYGDLDTPEATSLARHGLTDIELRMVQQALLHELPSLDIPAGGWNRRACAVLRDQGARLGIQAATTRVYQCRRPGDAAWRLVGFGNPKSTLAVHTAVDRASTVHGVKGEQADAVLAIVPTAGKEDDRSDRLIEAWTGGAATRTDADTAEALRVLYVAATRARRLVAFALSDGHLGAVEVFLAERGIPCRIPHRQHDQQTVVKL